MTQTKALNRNFSLLWQWVKKSGKGDGAFPADDA